jgi:hypothetical protein
MSTAAEKFSTAATLLYAITHEDEEEGIEAVFCRLHDKEFLGMENAGDASHNCLACNLQQGNENILKFLLSLELSDSDEDIEYAITVFFLLLYLQVEKLTTLFRIMGITQEYVEKHWSVLIEIRKWANFIKHPKGFLFSHHPSYLFEDDEGVQSARNNKSTIVFDYDMVLKFYKRESDDSFKQSIKELGNKKNITVIIPDPARIMSAYTQVCQEFCDKIKNNPHFQEVLRQHSTLEDY